jgi:hypothetical protein
LLVPQGGSKSLSSPASIPPTPSESSDPPGMSPANSGKICVGFSSDEQQLHPLP